MDNLKEHQIDAYNHIIEKEKNGPLKGGIMRLTMGLGKTRTILHLIKKEKEAGIKEKTLIVCPKGILNIWKDEKKKWYDDELKLILFHPNTCSNYKTITMKQLEKYDVIVTTYETLVSVNKKNDFSDSICEYGDGRLNGKVVGYMQKDEPYKISKKNLVGPNVLYGCAWRRIVLDEAQKIGNSKTKAFVSTCALYSEYRWCLSGTPIKNGEKNMWSLLHFCGMIEPSNPKDFTYEDYVKYKDIMLVKDYSDTDIILPKHHECIEKIDFSEEELDIYKSYFNELTQTYNDHKTGKTKKGGMFACILGLFIRLRQICISPYLLTSESKRKSDRISNKKTLKLKANLDEYIHDKASSGLESSKINKIFDKIKNIPREDKIIIFSSFNASLDLLNEKINSEDVNYKAIMIDGSIKADDRNELLIKFNTDDDYRVLLCNLKIGSEGLNLQAANHVLFVESWWTSSVIDQAIARCLRVGQQKEVYSYKFVVNRSIEEGIEKICESKRTIANQYIYGDVDGRKDMPKLDLETLGQILECQN